MSDSSQDSDGSSDSDHSSGSEDNESERTGDERLKLRKYQRELTENAMDGKNTIICAGTGSGKTHVVMRIVQHHLDGAPKGTRKVVFMAKTGVLIKQQSEKLKKYLHQYQTRLITGDEGRVISINMLMEHNDIFCFTPQILVNSLEDKIVESLSEFSLIILDECHNTRGEEPYSVLMRKYLVEKHNGNKKLPQVVGLTASVGVGSSRTISEAKEHILRLCACLDVTKLSTVKKNEKEYKKHNQDVKEETIHLIKQTSDPCGDILRAAIKETEEKLDDNALMQPDIIDLISEKQPKDKESQEYNKWTIEVMKAAQLKVDDYDISRDIISCAKYLNIYNSAMEVRKLLRTKDIIKYLAENHKQEGEHKSKLTEMENDLYKNLIEVQKKLKSHIKTTNENPNVSILRDTLKKMIEDKGGESRAMVFVKTRATCRSLAEFLDKDLQEIDVKASPFYGKESCAGDEGMTESKQTDILENFREGFYKVLVCTSVGNEGIDIPNCDIVLSYEYSGDEIMKIQMKGRARSSGATTITMGSEKIVEQERINAFKALMMHRALGEVDKMTEKQIELKIKSLQKEEIQKYLSKQKTMNNLKSSKTREDEYDILCGRCNVLVCKISDVRQLGNDRIVIDNELVKRIEKKDHKKPKTYAGIFKKFKMYCKKCPLDWGMIGIKDGLDLMTLNIKNLKFKSLRTGHVSVYRNWDNMPYDVQKITFTDLSDLLNCGNDLEESQDQSIDMRGNTDRICSDVETPMKKQAVDARTDEVVTQTKEVARESGLTGQQDKITDESPTQAKTRKRKLDSDENRTQTGDGSKDKDSEENLTQPEQSTKGNLTTDLKCNTISKQNRDTDGDDTQGIILEKRSKTSTEERKNDEMNEGEESCTSSLSSAGSSGYPFKKELDDTLSESMVNKLSEQMKSVGAFIAPGRFIGTVFRVGSRYVMTAYHVVKDFVDHTGQISDNSVYVCFNELLDERQKTTFLLNKEVFRSTDLDVSVLEILTHSETLLPPAMALSKGDADLTLHLEDVSFIGYGHQTSNIKHLDARCKLVSPSSQRLKDAHEWLKRNVTYYRKFLRENRHDPDIVNEGYGDYNDRSKLLFDSFMQKGASGSPALTNNDSRSVKVVGIFTHGLPEFYFLLPRMVQVNVLDKYRFEVGSKMSNVYQAIMTYNKTLAEELFD